MPNRSPQLDPYLRRVCSANHLVGQRFGWTRQTLDKHGVCERAFSQSMQAPKCEACSYPCTTMRKACGCRARPTRYLVGLGVWAAKLSGKALSSWNTLTLSLPSGLALSWDWSYLENPIDEHIIQCYRIRIGVLIYGDAYVLMWY